MSPEYRFNTVIIHIIPDVHLLCRLAWNYFPEVFFQPSLSESRNLIIDVKGAAVEMGGYFQPNDAFAAKAVGY